VSIRKNIDRFLRGFEKLFTTQNLIEVSKTALLHNFDMFADLSGQQIIPVLKGNAYGHSIELVAAALKDRSFPYIAVDGYFEALRIREVSKQPVLVMGAILPENFARMKYDNFAFVVQDVATIHALGQTGKRTKVHLEINTGMNRYGVQLGEVATLVRLIQSYKNLALEGVMSHLADSDGNDLATVEAAVNIFDTCVEAVYDAGAKPTILHISQSAGSLKARSTHANTMRLGIGLYGINPFPQDHVLHIKLQGKLQPALRLTSTITKIIELQQGEGVSYNYTFTAPNKMRIGVLPLGYYEGVNRALSNTGTMKIGNAYVPIIGWICMNHTMINLDDLEVRLGDKVVVYSNNASDQNSIDAIAYEHDLFAYNLLTALSSDVRRILIG